VNSGFRIRGRFVGVVRDGSSLVSPASSGKARIEVYGPVFPQQINIPLI